MVTEPGKEETRYQPEPKTFRSARRPGLWLRRGVAYRTPPPPRPWVGRLVVLLIRGLGLLPLRAIHLLATVVGGVASLLPVRDRRITEVNLRIAFPELDEAARRALMRRSMIETAKTFGELAGAWTWSGERLRGYLRQVSGDEPVRQAIASGRGVILAAPHLGSWEIGGALVAMQYTLTGLYQKPRLLELDAFIMAARERFGTKLVPAGLRAVRVLHRALARGEMVGILPDQDAGPGLGVFVPFFGETANTMMLLPRLAAKTGALVALAFAERLPRSRGFHIRWVLASDEIYDDDIERAAASLNRDIERCVREIPEQYLWSYKRFRIRPPGLPDPYRKTG